MSLSSTPISPEPVPANPLDPQALGSVRATHAAGHPASDPADGTADSAAITWLDRVLSPESLQRLMACGGGLLVLGFVTWLWSIGLFENPWMLAIGTGVATFGVLAVGIAMVRLTRFQLAGRSITLLGALALPLNLWLYDSQQLIAIAQGGHLWIPAAVCCVVYALIARTLRDTAFVYAFVGGIVLTGMLFLADQQVQRFWSLLPMVTFLAATGGLCMFSERLFPARPGDFSRQTFGLAFWKAGLLVLAAGLILLLGGQISQMIQGSIQGLCKLLGYHDGWFGIDLAPLQKLAAIGILLGSVVGLSLQAWIHQSRVMVLAAVGIGVWCFLSVLDYGAVYPTINHVAIGLAGLSIAMNMLTLWWHHRKNGDDPNSHPGKDANFVRLAEQGFPFAIVCLLAGFAVLIFCGQFLGGSRSDSMPAFLQSNWSMVTQFLITALALQFAAITHGTTLATRGQFAGFDHPLTRFAMTLAGPILGMGLFTIGLNLGWSDLWTHLLLGMIVPLSYAMIGFVLSDSGLRRGFQVVGTSALTLSLLCWMSFSAAQIIATPITHLMWAVIFAASAVIYFALNWRSQQGLSTAFGYTAITIASWQALLAAGLEVSFALVLAPTALGMCLSLWSRWMAGHTLAIDTDRSHLENKAVLSRYEFQNIGGLLLLLLGSVCGMMLSLNRLLAVDVNLGLLVVLGVQFLSTVAVSFSQNHADWRAILRASAVGTFLAMLVVGHNLLVLDWFHRAELMSLIAGILLLVVSHLCLLREHGESDDMVSVGLFFGSIMVALPLTMGLIAYRWEGASHQWQWWLFHEIAAVVVGLGLFGAGALGRVRWTTISGAVLLSTFVLSLAILIRWPSQLQSVSVVMMIGGGLFFVVSVLLSIYRDRLVQLPEKIKQGGGPFAILKWR